VHLTTQEGSWAQLLINDPPSGAALVPAWHVQVATHLPVQMTSGVVLE
jgi:hypothetical protein